MAGVSLGMRDGARVQTGCSTPANRRSQLLAPCLYPKWRHQCPAKRSIRRRGTGRLGRPCPNPSWRPLSRPLPVRLAARRPAAILQVRRPRPRCQPRAREHVDTQPVHTTGSTCRYGMIISRSGQRFSILYFRQQIVALPLQPGRLTTNSILPAPEVTRLHNAWIHLPLR